MYLFVKITNVRNTSKLLNITLQIKDLSSFRIQSGYLKAFKMGNLI
jgi:hypothetical protein